MKFLLKRNSGRLVKGLSTVFFLALFCVFFSFLFVYPLWFFADKNPKLFSIVVLLIFLTLIIYRVGKKIYVYFKTNMMNLTNNKKLITKLIKTFSFWIVIIITCFCIVYFIIGGNRFFALIPLGIGFFICTILQKK